MILQINIYPFLSFIFILEKDMVIKSLSVMNFRNHENTTIALSKGVNVLVGNNAQGKTNLLEAVYLTCVGKGWRTNKDREMINFSAEHARVRTVTNKHFGDCTVEINLSRTVKKSVKINDIPVQRMGELMGQVNCVFFSPDELRLIKDAPADRRRFLDIDISQMDKTYFYALLRYNKILLQRNALLKNPREDITAGLKIWDTQLARVGAQIIARRLSFIKQLKDQVIRVHNYLTDGNEKLELSYINITVGDTEAADYNTLSAPPRLSVTQAVPVAVSGFSFGGTSPKNTDRCSFPPSGVSHVEHIEQLLIKQLRASRDKDMNLRTTTVGPHRDDLKILIDGKDVRYYASQGQQRTVALSLKFSELEIFREATGEMPVLLLDDVLSELDAKRQERLLRALTKCQSLITSTSLPVSMTKGVSVFKVISGAVKS